MPTFNCVKVCLQNAATINFCFGDPQKTKLLFEQAAALKFAPPIALYNLGAIYSYFEDYAMAATKFDLYLQDLAQENSEPNLNQLLGIADTFQQDKQWKRAEQFYQKAYTEAETLRISGDESPAIELKLLYLKMVFAGFNEKTMTERQQHGFFTQMSNLVPLIVDPNAKMQIIYMYLMLEKIDNTKPFYLEICAICKAYKNAPGMDVFGKI